MSDDVKKDRANDKPKPVFSDRTENKTPLCWGKQMGLSEAKVAGVCAWAEWDMKQTNVSEAEFKRVSQQWLNHSPGSGKRPKKEVGK